MQPPVQAASRARLAHSCDQKKRAWFNAAHHWLTNGEGPTLTVASLGAGPHPGGGMLGRVFKKKGRRKELRTACRQLFCHQVVTRFSPARHYCTRNVPYRHISYLLNSIFDKCFTLIFAIKGWELLAVVCVDFHNQKLHILYAHLVKQKYPPLLLTARSSKFVCIQCCGRFRKSSWRRGTPDELNQYT